MGSLSKLVFVMLGLNLAVVDLATAQSRNGLSVMAGLTQPMLLGGANIAVQYETNNWVFEYSHGVNLKLHKFKQTMSSSDQDENLVINVPWTTGAGIGYRISDAFHVLIEVKAHKFEVSIPGGGTANYTGFSAGPSVFYTKYFGSNFFIQPNVRFWPTVGSSESGNKIQVKRADGSTYTHKIHDFSLFVNMNLGWTF